MAFGGDAMGRLPDGRTVFVPFGLAGDHVRIRIVEEKKRYARGEIQEILQPSPNRIQPKCLHYQTCGGCHYQHLNYSQQLEWKTNILIDQLKHIGGLQDIPIQPVNPSLSIWNYRNYVQFHLTDKGELGFQKFQSEEPFPLKECHIPLPDLNKLWPFINFEPIPGLQRIGLRKGVGEDAILILESNDLRTPELTVEDLPVSVIHKSQAGTLIMAGSDYVEMAIADRIFHVSAGSFFQVNTAMAEAMVDFLLHHLPLESNKTLLDVYCGVGLFSAFLAPKVARIVGIESSPEACSDYELNLDEFDNIELYEAPVEKVIPYLDISSDILIVDPPRSGISRAALQGIIHLAAPILIYISCNPSSLARDAKSLTASGYQLDSITPFDLFPQTYHIESISIWNK